MKNAPARSASSLLLGALVSAGFLSATAAQVPDIPKPDKPAGIPNPPAVREPAHPGRPHPDPRPLDELDSRGRRAADTLPAPPNPAGNAAKADAKAKARADARAQAPVPPVPEAVAPGAGSAAMPPKTDRAAEAVTSSLDAAKIAPTIRSSTVATRGPLMADIESRMASTAAAMASFDASAGEMSKENRAKYKAASADVKDKGKALKNSLRTARSSKEQDWDKARTQLATDYEAYAAAQARLDAATAGAQTKP